MTVKLGTVEFYQAMGDALNDDPVWADKGKNIDFDMAYKYEAPIEGQFFVSFDKGKVTDVREASQEDLDKADFLISGSSDVWRGCFDGSINLRRRSGLKSVRCSMGGRRSEGRAVTDPLTGDQVFSSKHWVFP